MKAIHNTAWKTRVFRQVFTVLQRYDFESNSQRLDVNNVLIVRCLPYCKGTILKAIHNEASLKYWPKAVFTVLQRYDFESNSQLKARQLVDN